MKMGFLKNLATFSMLALIALPPCSLAQETTVAPNVLKAIRTSNAPTFGSNGDITVIEFYDYQCGYCKSAEDGVRNLIATDKHVKVILMDFPKLGPMSLNASRATLASLSQGTDKYYQFHSILMRKDVHVSDEVLLQAAKAAGLDIAKLQQDMADPAIDQYIQYSMSLGRSAGVRVTPSFIIGKVFFPGFLDQAGLRQNIAWVRAKHLN